MLNSVGPPLLPQPLILCPLDVEARWLAGAAPSLPRATVVGPHDSVRHWIARHARPGTLPILCGLAGALRADVSIGTAHLVDRVTATAAAGLDTEARSMRESSLRESPLALDGLSTVMALTVASTVTEPAERARLAAERPEAALIDCESWWFAGACATAGLPWLIVRGVSDGPNDRLPPSIDGWVGADGRTRIGAVMRSLLRRPTDICALPRLARSGNAAMASVGRLVEAVLDRFANRSGTR